MSVKFGTGGWRAIIGDGFTKENLQLLVTALARKMKSESLQETNFIIGYDRRFLSVEAAHWAAEAMAGEGIKCLIIANESPTPLVMFTVKHYKAHYGMAVTASHNPALFNGVKVFTKGGKDADETVTDDIERFINLIAPSSIKTIPYEEGIKLGIIEQINPQNIYLDAIIKNIDMDAIRKSNLKVILDPMYGVSKTSLQTILLTARCDLSIIHERHDTLFGGRLPSPNAKTLNALRNFVLESKADIGIATDGDADRLGIINDKGGFVHPNQILVILYYYLLKYKGLKGPAVRNVATTHLLDKVAKAFGETCYEVNVGFKHISKKMIQTKALIGGESSGGLAVRGHIQGKDGIHAATLLIEMLAVTGQKLSEIYNNIILEFGNLIMEEYDFRFSQERKEEILKILMEDKKLPSLPYDIKRVSYADGCKVYFNNGGWIIVRFSGTEPLIRIFCEMEDSNKANEVCDIFINFLKLT